MDSNNKRLKHCMQILLPLKCVEHAINLQLIEPHIKLYAESHTELYAKLYTTSVEKNGTTLTKFLTLLKEVHNTNQMNTQIWEYLKALSKRKKPTIHINSCRISNSLLMKTDCLWVLKSKNS